MRATTSTAAIPFTRCKNCERRGVGGPWQIRHPGGEFIGSNYIRLL